MVNIVLLLRLYVIFWSIRHLKLRKGCKCKNEIGTKNCMEKYQISLNEWCKFFIFTLFKILLNINIDPLISARFRHSFTYNQPQKLHLLYVIFIKINSSSKHISISTHKLLLSTILIRKDQTCNPVNFCVKTREETQRNCTYPSHFLTDMFTRVRHYS